MSHVTNNSASTAAAAAASDSQSNGPAVTTSEKSAEVLVSNVTDKHNNKLAELGDAFAAVECENRPLRTNVTNTINDKAEIESSVVTQNANKENVTQNAQASFFSEAAALFTPHQWQARIICKGQLCTLRFNKDHDELSITRVNRHGRELTLLKVKTNYIVNLESAKERVSRQLGRRANDDVVRSGFHHQTERLSLLCVCPAIVHERSRATVETRNAHHQQQQQIQQHEQQHEQQHRQYNSIQGNVHGSSTFAANNATMTNSNRGGYNDRHTATIRSNISNNYSMSSNTNSINSNINNVHKHTLSTQTESANNIYFDNGTAASAVAAEVHNTKTSNQHFRSSNNYSNSNINNDDDDEQHQQNKRKPLLTKTFASQHTNSHSSVQNEHHTHNNNKKMQYYLHYVRLHGQLAPTLHTIEFSCVEDKLHGTLEFKALMLALLRYVYSSGVKNIRVYISPTSGKGNGVEVFATEVYPILHFSRHNLITHVTTRPHDCEDRLADLTTTLSAYDVIVGAGGDGMIHEVVNGLHRRKVALIHKWRELQRNCGYTNREQQEQQPEEEQEEKEEEEQKKIKENDVEEHKMETKEEFTNVQNSRKDTIHRINETLLDQKLMSSCTSADKSAFASSTGSILNRSVTLPECLRSLHLHFDPQELAQKSNQVQDTLFSHGWEELMPMVATIPTGSACGMAKSMDVLTTIDAALALVHLQSCEMDLLRMRFSSNEDMLNFHKAKLSSSALTRAISKYNDYIHRYARELGVHLNNREYKQAFPIKGSSNTQSALTATSNNKNDCTKANMICNTEQTNPYLRDGTGIYHDAVSFHVKAPFLRERVAFMSLSFGMANDIDHGSEHLRWMGNARFAVYGGIMILRGPQVYKATLRYLPWDDAVTGLKVEKLRKGDKMPHPSQLPPCTMREKCPHCLRHSASPQSPWARRSSMSSTTHAHSETSPLLWNNSAKTQCTSFASPECNCYNEENNSTNNGIHACSTSARRHSHNNINGAYSEDVNLSAFRESELLNEDEVDFDDNSLPWVTIEGEFFNILLCNVKDVARDVLIAPIAHLSDGAIDIVFSRKDPETNTGSRKEFLQFFLSLEKGKHVEFEFTNYVKARAAEVKVDHGISMSDGEMMPLSTVRITKLRHAVRFVRSE